MTSRSRIYGLVLLVLGLAAAWGPAQAQDMQLCENSNVRTRAAYSACDQLVASGRLSGRDLAAAYYGRAFKHVVDGHSDDAIRDFSSAIKADPTWSYPYVARGHAYARKGDHQKAFAD